MFRGPTSCFGTTIGSMSSPSGGAAGGAGRSGRRGGERRGVCGGVGGSEGGESDAETDAESRSVGTLAMSRISSLSGEESNWIAIRRRLIGIWHVGPENG